MINNWRAQSERWWAERSPREKQVLTAGGIFLIFFACYQFFWSPFINYNESLREKIKLDQKNLAWMQSADLAIKSNSSGIPEKMLVKPVELLSILQQQLIANNLQTSLQSLRQASSNTIEIQLQKINFDELMRFLINLNKTYALQITQFSATANNVKGIVDAHLILQVDE